MDFFSGSAPTAHAVLEQNRIDGGNRRFIAVQIAEPLQDFRISRWKTIFDMGRLRLLSLINEIESEGDEVKGFRVLKIDTSNMQGRVLPSGRSRADRPAPRASTTSSRTVRAEDLLFQVLVDWGVDLTLPIRRETVQGKTVFFVDEQRSCRLLRYRRDRGTGEGAWRARAAARRLPRQWLRLGRVKINVEQIFRQLSPGTEVKSI